MKSVQMFLLLGLTIALPSTYAHAGKWPEKPVRIVVPFAAGGGTDAIARTIALRLSEDFGQQFVIEDRPGAGGTIGAEFVARSAPDGYTALFVSASYAASSNPKLYRTSYDPVKDIAPIGQVATLPLILAVHPSVPATTLKQFIDYARAHPNDLAYGSAGNGGTLHLAAELFRQMTQTDLVHVPYKGSNFAITDLLAGRIQAVFCDPTPLLPHLKEGTIRGLAVTTEKRQAVAPNLPPIGELVPGYVVNSWFGLWAPGGTPREIITAFNQGLKRALDRPDLQQRLRADGNEPAYTTPEEFGRIIERDIALWAGVVERGHIKLD